ncbi:30S ribosomal protein S8 [Candidatus Hepatincolaceae symbiont of Richtersius coronifer]
MDIISDMLTRIRNGLMAKKSVVDVLYSKQNLGILKVLKEAGYIKEYKEVDIRKGVKSISVDLSYYNGEPVIKELKRISKSSRRFYRSIEDLPLIFNGLGISILSTSHGVLSDTEARAHNVGGEIICSVF